MPRRSTFDKDRARALYAEGKTDVEIADMIGATASAVKAWRRREGLYTPRPNSDGTRPEVTVEIPEGLQPAAKRGVLDGFTPVPLAPPTQDRVPEAPPPAQDRVPEAAPPADQELPQGETPAPFEKTTEDPLTVDIRFRGCFIHLDAASLEQVAAAGKLLAGFSVVLENVPIPGTGDTPRG